MNLDSEGQVDVMTETAGSSNVMVIERYFDAPVEVIWQLWTNPDHFRAWYGPDGAVIPVAKMDVRVGGARLVCMQVDTPGGPMQMWFAGEYREVVDYERLVYTEFISDEHGQASHTADHPTTEVRVELEDVGGRTKLTLTHVGIPQDSPGASGWMMALDKLSARVATVEDQSD
jgi:uncharacterized protein YndB with AHSA1/START domain